MIVQTRIGEWNGEWERHLARYLTWLELKIEPRTAGDSATVVIFQGSEKSDWTHYENETNMVRAISEYCEHKISFHPVNKY